jgi:Leucine-rich repeat (LRR) protein
MRRLALVMLGLALVGCSRERAPAGGTRATAAVDPQTAPPPRSNVARYHLRKQGWKDPDVDTWLASLPEPTGLTSLDIRDNELSSAALDAIDRSRLGAIEELMLSGNPLGDAGGRSVGGGAKFQNARILWMDRTKLGRDGVESLLGKASKLTYVDELNLSENPLGDDGVAAVASSEKCENLSALYLSKVGMTDRGAAALAASQHLTKLKDLDVSGNALSKDAIDLLKRGLGKVRVKTD